MFHILYCLKMPQFSLLLSSSQSWCRSREVCLNKRRKFLVRKTIFPAGQQLQSEIIVLVFVIVIVIYCCFHCYCYCYWYCYCYCYCYSLLFSLLLLLLLFEQAPEVFGAEDNLSCGSTIAIGGNCFIFCYCYCYSLLFSLLFLLFEQVSEVFGAVENPFCCS